MEKESLHHLINQDDLKGAIELLLQSNTTGKKAKSVRLLKGRLLDLSRQNNQGILSLESYNLEKNKIRLALLDVIETEDTEDNKPKIGYIKIITAALVIIMSVVAVFTLSNRDEVATPTDNKEMTLNPKTEGAQPPASNAQASISQLEQVKSLLTSEDIRFTMNQLTLNEEREYKVGLAYLKRNYSWETDIVIEIPKEKIIVTDIDNTKTLQVNIREAKLSPAIYVRNKKSRTITNSFWQEEGSQDGRFWEDVNELTQAKINNRLQTEPNQKLMVKEAIENLIQTKIKTVGQGEVDIKIEKLVLYNGEVLIF